ncbi:MAG: pentapeptide repeat-containing protein [Prochloraceae cyanobacterium]|nr:pentapeptide repeat-containing protein [Prochloraceae cyanobacterium]
MKLWKNIWNSPNIDIEINWNDGVLDGREAGKQVLKLARALYENQSDTELGSQIGKISSLLDVLNLPLVEVATASFPFVFLATKILNLIKEKTKQDPTLETCLILTTQAAYLESLRQFLQQHPRIKEKLNDTSASKAVAHEIKKLGESPRLGSQQIELEVEEAENTLMCFHQSKLAKVFNQILLARLQDSGIEFEQAKTLTDRICRSTHRHMERTFIEVKEAIPRLTAIYGDRWQKDLETYLVIDTYLQEVIAKKPWEYFLHEDFTYNNIYVPLEVKPVRKDGKSNYYSKSQDIETWAKKTLLNERKQGRILLIQAGAGMGKSVFCRIFADWVRRQLAPIWTPIVISLKDVKDLKPDFEKILDNTLGWNFANGSSGWLKNSNTRFLFLLDGFDELILAKKASSDLKLFLQKIALFQKQCQKNSELGHRVLITGKPLSLYGIERLMPNNIDRVEIIPMSEGIQKKWFNRWETIVNTEPHMSETQSNNLQNVLQDPRCPEKLKILAKEPLSLHLLSLLNEDNQLNVEIFANLSMAATKTILYEKAVDWLLKKQIFESGTSLNIKIGDIEDLRSIMGEAGLCAVQSGRQYAPLFAIFDRLKEKNDEVARALISRVYQQSQETAFNNPLFTLHHNKVGGVDRALEFSHNSFGEFFCAESMAKIIQKWADRTGQQGENYLISTERLEWQIYDIFGYNILNPDLVQYLIGLLEKNEVDLLILFERLHEFYLRWSEGVYIEVTQDTLPQRKARQLQKQKISRGQREVDIYAGLNIFIFLLELHRYAQSRKDLKNKIIFYICGQPDTEDFDKTRLLRIATYSYSLEAFAFNQRLGRFFRGANLTDATLTGLDLKGLDLSDSVLKSADLRIADLRGVNFRGAKLKEVDLNSAVLRNANLSLTEINGSNLSSADLRGANLSGALLISMDLSEADLSGADLSGAMLRDVDLSGADLSGVDLRETDLKEIEQDSETKWTNAIGVKTVNGKPVIN